jgi:hypothetical protein
MSANTTALTANSVREIKGLQGAATVAHGGCRRYCNRGCRRSCYRGCRRSCRRGW